MILEAKYTIPMKEIYETLGTNIELLGFRGSQSHGLYVPKDDPKHIDDVDLIIFNVAPPSHYLGLTEWGSRGTMDFWIGEYDIVCYELKKAFSLLLNGNPNILSVLWLDHYLYNSPVANEIIKNRELFVGKHVYNSFAGYASAQLQKMENRDPEELRLYLAVTDELKLRGKHPTDNGIPFGYMNRGNDGERKDVAAWDTEKLLAKLRHYQRKGENLGYMGDKRKHLVLEIGYDSKNSANCIRLLKMAKEFLADGIMRVVRKDDREELLAIKAGKWKLEHIKSYAEQLFSDVKEAHVKSPLPTEPNFKEVEKLLISLLKGKLV